MEFVKLDKIILPCSKTLEFTEIYRLHVLAKRPDGSQVREVWVLQSELRKKLLGEPGDKDWSAWMVTDEGQHHDQAR